MRIICEDLKRAIYDSFYINMISSISRPNLEELAASAVQGAVAHSVQKISDQYLNFISLENDLFMLRKYTNNSSISFLGYTFG